MFHFAIIASLLLLSANAETCYNEFTAEESGTGQDIVVEPESIFDPSIVRISYDVAETTSEDTILYTVYWIDDLSNPPQITAASPYITTTNVKDFQFDIVIQNSVMGLPDYTQATPIEQIDLRVFFEFIENSTTWQCTMNLAFPLLDVNTQPPIFTNIEKDSSVLEGLPIGLELAHPLIYVTDYDRSAENTEFEVIVDENCPIESYQSNYFASDAREAQVSFSTKLPLDFDVLNDTTIFCNITIVNTIAPFLNSTDVLAFLVGNYSDENPIFTQDLYEAALSTTTSGSQIDIGDDVIAAPDQDVPPDNVTYDMDAIYPSNGLDYFVIDEHTGIVSLKTDLDNQFLELNQIAIFTLLASDSNGGHAQATLNVELPIPLDLSTIDSTSGTITTASSAMPSSANTNSTVSSPVPNNQTSSTNIISTTTPRSSTVTLPLINNLTSSTNTKSTTTPVSTSAGTKTTSIITESSKYSSVSTCPSCMPCITTEVTTIPPGNLEATFTSDLYRFQAFQYTNRIGQIQAKTNILHPSEIIYLWLDDSNDTLYFDLDNITGVITASNYSDELQIRQYYLRAGVFSDNVFYNDTNVSVSVFESINSTTAIMLNSLIETEIDENGEYSNVIQIFASNAESFCIVQVFPSGFSYSVYIDPTTGFLSIYFIDYESNLFGKEVQSEHKIYVKVAASETEYCNSSNYYTSYNETFKNETMVIFTVLNTNDNPSYYMPDANVYTVAGEYYYFGFPVDTMLQRTAGSITKFQVFDADEPGDFRYMIENASENYWLEIDYFTGELYMSDDDSIEYVNWTEDEPFEFRVMAKSDIEPSVIYKNTKILGIKMDKILTLTVQWMNYNISTTIDAYLGEASVACTTNFRALYYNVGSSKVYIHATAEFNGTFFTSQQIIDMKRTCKSHFDDVEDFRDSGLFVISKTGLIVTTSIFGFILLVIIAVCLFMRIMGYKIKKSTKPNSSQQVYENHQFQSDEDKAENFQTIFANSDNPEGSVNYSPGGTIRSDIFKIDQHIYEEVQESPPDLKSPPSYESSNKQTTSSNLYPSIDEYVETNDGKYTGHQGPSTFDSSLQKDEEHYDPVIEEAVNEQYSELQKKEEQMLVLNELHVEESNNENSITSKEDLKEKENILFPPILTNEILEKKLNEKKSSRASSYRSNSIGSTASKENELNESKTVSIDTNNPEKKSVAFKILVDTKTIEGTSKQKEESDDEATKERNNDTETDSEEEMNDTETDSEEEIQL